MKARHFGDELLVSGGSPDRILQYLWHASSLLKAQFFSRCFVENSGSKSSSTEKITTAELSLHVTWRQFSGCFKRNKALLIFGKLELLARCGFAADHSSQKAFHNPEVMAIPATEELVSGKRRLLLFAVG